VVQALGGVAMGYGLDWSLKQFFAQESSDIGSGDEVAAVVEPPKEKEEAEKKDGSPKKKGARKGSSSKSSKSKKASAPTGSPFQPMIDQYNSAQGR
jgi:hypothetical protein